MLNNTQIHSCPLCGGRRHQLFHQDKLRPYFQCETCRLVFVPPEHHLAPEQEKACYDFHRNDPADTGYRRFLDQLCQPMRAQLEPGMRGLDFGCGPGPTLSLMFEEAGFPCSIYDPFYANDPAALEQRYDFLSCSEAIEHFQNPRKEFERFLELVRPGGLIGIMTQRVKDQAAFKNWHYTADETHICYFSEATFRWMAERYNLQLEFPHKSVALFRCP